MWKKKKNLPLCPQQRQTAYCRKNKEPKQYSHSWSWNHNILIIQVGYSEFNKKKVWDPYIIAGLVLCVLSRTYELSLESVMHTAGGLTLYTADAQPYF